MGPHGTKSDDQSSIESHPGPAGEGGAGRAFQPYLRHPHAPNYDLTSGDMAKRLGAMEDRSIHHLAHQMLAARLPGESALPHELAAITEQARGAAQELRAATLAVIAQRASAGGPSAAAPSACWWGSCSALGTAALLPRQTGVWMAATMVGGGPCRWRDPDAKPNRRVDLCHLAMSRMSCHTQSLLGGRL